ncbi:MAG: alpha/beta fold hydrolase [Negativicutes bacterium]
MMKFAKIFLVLMLVLTFPFSVSASEQIKVKEIGSVYYGGQTVSLAGMPLQEVVYSPGAPAVLLDSNGDVQAGQMYAQFVKLADPKGKYPVVMIHGGGLCGTCWETTPDGRPGWQMSFLQAGNDVYVTDAVERGRASWARYPEIYSSAPVFRTAQEAWPLFRFGEPGAYSTDPAQRIAFTGQQFPIQSFDIFMKSSIPRWFTNNDITLKAYSQMLQETGPVVLLAHSQGAWFAIEAAMKHPDKVKALILIEPSGNPDLTKEDISVLKNIPVMFMFGDFIEKSPTWTKIIANQKKWRDALIKQGNDVTWIDLPLKGIKGNSHMIMMDKNSDQTAALVHDWMKQKKLVNK